MLEADTKVIFFISLVLKLLALPFLLLKRNWDCILNCFIHCIKTDTTSSMNLSSFPAVTPAFSQKYLKLSETAPPESELLIIKDNTSI